MQLINVLFAVDPKHLINADNLNVGVLGLTPFFNGGVPQEVVDNDFETADVQHYAFFTGADSNTTLGVSNKQTACFDKKRSKFYMGVCSR